MSSQPAIIEAAINGATTKDRNPNVPRSAEEIAADALACRDHPQPRLDLEHHR